MPTFDKIDDRKVIDYTTRHLVRSNMEGTKLKEFKDHEPLVLVAADRLPKGFAPILSGAEEGLYLARLSDVPDDDAKWEWRFHDAAGSINNGWRKPSTKNAWTGSRFVQVRPVAKAEMVKRTISLAHPDDYLGRVLGHWGKVTSVIFEKLDDGRTRAKLVTDGVDPHSGATPKGSEDRTYSGRTEQAPWFWVPKGEDVGKDYPY